MLNFTFCTPTKIIFGRDIEGQIGPELKNRGAHRVLVHFGGGSARKSGLLDKVERSLQDAGLTYVELGGVEPNPKIGKVREGIALCKQEQVDFLLAVGGGSVIDSAKGIGMGVGTGRDPWEFAATKTAPDKTLPVATVLTISAAGSEMSNSCVMTNPEGNLKRGVTSETNRPVVSFLNPENTFTVSPFQTGCGIVDIMMHTLERYLTVETDTPLTDRIAESLLVTVQEAGRRALQAPTDYEARATLMWASSLSHNGLTACGRKQLFPVHKLEHELSGLHDHVSHGAGLAVLFPAWAQYVLSRDTQRFAQLAIGAFGVTMDCAHPENTAREGILAFKRYCQEIGMPTTMSELGIPQADYDRLADMTIAATDGVKSYGVLGKQDVLQIYQLAEQ